MARITVTSGMTLALTLVLSTAGIVVGTGAANAVVYCRAVGVPQGCVVAPAAPVAAAAAATPGRVVGTPYVAGPGAGAAGVGVRPGTPVNRGGPVNRVGTR